MLSADATTTPPTLTPVFDASNCWAAIRVNPGQASRPDHGLREALAALDAHISAAADDDAVHPLSRLPLLLSTDDPLAWMASVERTTPGCKLGLLLPASAEVSAQAIPDEFPAREVRLMLRGPTAESPATLPLCIDVTPGFNGEIQGLLHRNPGPHLASNVGTADVHRQCVSAGFQWFEGYWPMQPDPSKVPHNDTSRTTLLKLLGQVSNDADAGELETLLKKDPHLSYQLLKIVNSVGFALRQKISNFNQAITVLGRRQLQRWLQLLLFAGHHGDGKVSALFSIAARRAAFMEYASAASGGKADERDQAFMVGLFSLLDILLSAPLEELVTPLNLDDAITKALVAGEGRLGNLLALAVSTESAPDEVLSQRLKALAIAPDVFLEIQLKAMAWAVQVSGEMQ